VAISAKFDPAAMDRLRKRMLAMAGPEAQAEMVKANEKSAADFKAGIVRIIPRGDPAAGNLVDSLQDYAVGPTGRGVSIGGPGHRYPLHLEAGHRNRDGSHTPGKPFWNPTKRVLMKRINGRAVRAERAAIKRITAG
jgi:hypothetical protein